MKAFHLILLTTLSCAPVVLGQQALVRIRASVPETTEPSPNVRIQPGAFVISRADAPPLAPLTIALTYDGSATPDRDYVRLPETVTLAEGALELTLLVEPLEDNEVEGDEVVVARLHAVAGVPGGAGIAPDQREARMVIHDNEFNHPKPPRVRIEATRRIAEETSAPLRRIRFDGQFTISRTGSTEHSQPVWVHYSGSSTPGEDYAPLPLLVSIPAGAEAVEIAVEATPDEIPEPIETLVATISNCPPPGLRAPCYEFPIDTAHQQATVFIRDDGITRATVELVRPENGAHFEIGQPIHLQAVAIDLESYIHRVEFWSGDQQVGVSEIHFFVAPDPGTPIVHSFEWEDAAPGEHILTARARLLAENNSVTVVSRPVHITVGPAPSERVVLEISSPDSLAREPGPNQTADTARFTVRRSAGPLNIAVGAFYMLDGTAENGKDYERLSGEVLLPAGAHAVDVIVRALPDELPEGEETVVARLIAIPCLPEPPPECYLIGPQGEARAVILDRASEGRPPRAEISHPSPGAEFEPGAPVEIRVVAVDPDGYVRQVAFFADERQIGEQVIDFIQPPEPGQTQTFEFVWENALPGAHRLTARVTDNHGLHGSAPPVEILVRRAESLPVVAVLMLDPFAREPGPNIPANNASFGIVRFGPSDVPLEVGYSLGGTAENGVDYVELSGRILIPAGHETALITVVPRADEKTEGLETVGLRLNESTHYLLAPEHRSAKAVIADHNQIRTGAHCLALSDGSRYLCFTAPGGGRFRIEATRDLHTWITLFEGDSTDEAVHFVDDEDHPYRFYRLVPLE